MKVDVPFNNFARGKIDHDAMGRFDLPIFQSSLDLCENFITNFKGNAIYRAGYESIFEFQDCVFIEFKFTDAQQYLCVFYGTTMRFLSYDVNGDFGWVLNSLSDILEVSHPYTLDQCRELDYSQNNDVMVVVHPTFAPYKLTRVSANSFTFLTFARTNDPFTGSGLYPSKVLFYKGRLYYAAPTTKPTTVYGSVSGGYDDFTSTPVTATSALTFTIADISQPINWLFPGDNSLIVGSSDGIVAVNGGSVNEPITASTVEATLTSAQPCNSVYPIKKDSLVFYIGRDGRTMHYFQYDILKEAFQAQDANFLSYDITEGGITKIRHKKDRNDLIFGLIDNDTKSLLSCNFKLDENIIGWHEHITEGQFLDQAVITDNAGNPQLFVLTLRNGAYFIERHGDYVQFKKRVKFFTGQTSAEKAADEMAFKRYVAEQLKQCVYLDNALVYSDLQSNLITYNSGAGTITATSGVFISPDDVGKHIVYKTDTGYESGRFEITAVNSSTVVEVDVLQTPTASTYTDWYLTFSQLTGASQYDGTEVGVVADGGYLDDFTVSGGTIDLGRQVTHAVIGYKYKGILKSFCMGFQVQAINTQRTVKSLAGFSVRTVSTMGLQVGSSLYKLEPLQTLSADDVNYLPPTPVDGTRYVQFTDDAEVDKFFYAVQEEPGPAVITLIMPNVKFGTAT